jgi:hypothetical protein
VSGFESVGKCAEEANPNFDGRNFSVAILLSILAGLTFFLGSDWCGFVRVSMAESEQQPAVSHGGCIRTCTTRPLDCRPHHGIGPGGVGAGIQRQHGGVISSTLCHVAPQLAQPATYIP